MAAPPALTFDQTRLLARLAAVSAANGGRALTWRCEWSGYLPFGVVQWMECAGGDVSRDFPTGWSESDLHALERAGRLAKVSARRSPDDEFDRSVSYRVTSSPGPSR